jgi:hypothetical protein
VLPRRGASVLATLKTAQKKSLTVPRWPRSSSPALARAAAALAAALACASTWSVAGQPGGSPRAAWQWTGWPGWGEEAVREVLDVAFEVGQPGFGGHALLDASVRIGAGAGAIGAGGGAIGRGIGAGWCYSGD